MTGTLFWCMRCNVIVIRGVNNIHVGHVKEVVGIREDIFHEAMQRLAKDLKRTGRLEPFGETK